LKSETSNERGGKFLSSIGLIDIPTTDDRWKKKDDGDSPNDPVFISNGESTDVPLTIIIDTNSDTNGGIAKIILYENGGAETTIVGGRFAEGATWFWGVRGTRRGSWYGGLSCRGMRNRTMPHLKRAERNQMRRLWC
jgi:hypothetical protein